MKKLTAVIVVSVLIVIATAPLVISLLVKPSNSPVYIQEEVQD